MLSCQQAHGLPLVQDHCQECSWCSEISGISNGDGSRKAGGEATGPVYDKPGDLTSTRGDEEPVTDQSGGQANSISLNIANAVEKDLRLPRVDSLRQLSPDHAEQESHVSTSASISALLSSWGSGHAKPRRGATPQSDDQSSTSSSIGSQCSSPTVHKPYGRWRSGATENPTPAGRRQKLLSRPRVHTLHLKLEGPHLCDLHPDFVSRVQQFLSEELRMPPLHVSVGQGCIHLVVVVLEVARGAVLAGRGAQRLRRRNASIVAAQLPELLLGFVRQMLPENAAPVSVSACHNNEAYQLTGDDRGAAAEDAATHPPSGISEQQLLAAAAAANPGPPSEQDTAAEGTGEAFAASGMKWQEIQEQQQQQHLRSQRVPAAAPSSLPHALGSGAGTPSVQSLNDQELPSPFVGTAVRTVAGTLAAAAADPGAPGEPFAAVSTSVSPRPQGGRMPCSVNLLPPPPAPARMGQRIHRLQLLSQPQRPLVHTSAPEFRGPTPGSIPSSELHMSPSGLYQIDDAASEPAQGARAAGPTGSRSVAPMLWSPIGAESSPSALPSAGAGTPSLPGGAATPARLLYRPVSRAGVERPSWSVLGPGAGAAPAAGVASAAGAGAGTVASVLSSRSMRFDVPDSLRLPMLPPMPALSDLHLQAPPVGVDLLGPMVRVHPPLEDLPACVQLADFGVLEPVLQMARVEQLVSTAGGSKESLLLVLRCPDVIVRRKSMGPAVAGRAGLQQERSWAASGTAEGQQREQSPCMEQEGEERDEAGGAERQEADENSGSLSSSGRGALAAGPVSQLVAWCRSGSVSVAQVDDSAAGVTIAVLALQPQWTWAVQPRPAVMPADANAAAAAAASDAELYEDMRPVRQRSSPLAIAAAAAAAAVPDLYSDSTAGDAVGEDAGRVRQARARSAAWGQVLVRPASTSHSHLLEAVLRTAEALGTGMHEGGSGADNSPHQHQQLMQQLAVSVSSPNSIGRKGHAGYAAPVPAGPSASASLHSGSMALYVPPNRRAAPAAAVPASAEPPRGSASNAATISVSGESAQGRADAADAPLHGSSSSSSSRTAGGNGGGARPDTSPQSALAAERIRQGGAPATSGLQGGMPPPMLLLQVAWRRGQLLGPTCPVLLLPARLSAVAAELMALQVRLLPPEEQQQELDEAQQQHQQQQPRAEEQRGSRSSATPVPEAAAREEVATAFRAFLTDLGTWLEAVLPVTLPAAFPAAAAASATTTLSSPASGAQATRTGSYTGSSPLTDGSTAAAYLHSPCRPVTASPPGPSAPPTSVLPAAAAEAPRASSSTDGSTLDGSDRAHLVDEVLWLGCDLVVYTATCGLTHTTLLLLQHLVTYLATWPHTSRASVGTSGVASSIPAAAVDGGGRWSRSGTGSSAGGTASGSSGSSQLLNSRLLPPLLQQQQESMVLCRVLECCQDCSEHGRSLLHVAVEACSMPLVRLLVQDLPYKYGNSVLDVLAAPDRRGVTAMQYLAALVASTDSGGRGGGRSDARGRSQTDSGRGGGMADADGPVGSSEGEGLGEGEGVSPQSIAAAFQRAFAEAALEVLQLAGVGQARRLHVVLESIGSGVLPGQQQQQQQAREEQDSLPAARRSRRSPSSSTHSSWRASSSTISSVGGGSVGGGSARSGSNPDGDVLLASPVQSSLSVGSRSSVGAAGLAAIAELQGEEDATARAAALAPPGRPARPWTLASGGPPSARLWQPLQCLVLLLLGMLQALLLAAEMANVSAASPASFSASSFAFVLPPLAFMLSAGLAAVVLLGCSQRVLAELPWLPAAITTSGRMVASLLAAAVSRGLPASVAAGGGAGGTAVGVATMAAAGQQGGASVMAAARGALLRQGLSAGDASLRTLLLTLAPVAVEQTAPRARAMLMAFEYGTYVLCSTLYDGVLPAVLVWLPYAAANIISGMALAALLDLQRHFRNGTGTNSN